MGINWLQGKLAFATLSFAFLQHHQPHSHHVPISHSLTSSRAVLPIRTTALRHLKEHLPLLSFPVPYSILPSPGKVHLPRPGVGRRITLKTTPYSTRPLEISVDLNNTLSSITPPPLLPVVTKDCCLLRALPLELRLM